MLLIPSVLSTISAADTPQDKYGGYVGTPVIDLPYHQALHRPGWEERGPEFRKWLAPSVRIGGGSGTMCHYDGQWMYVISCGHLFPRGMKTAAQYKNSPSSRTIEVFYQNDVKLDRVKRYKAEVLCHVWQGVWDVSLMRFKPDWHNPRTMSIASDDYELTPETEYHSCGCDGRSEVAHYLVTYLRERERGSVTEVLTSTKNGPRRGRSGGGVFTEDGQLVFICSRGDGGAAYWTSLNQIHKFLNQEGFEFVLQGSIARRIPIKDRNGPQKDYPKDYIPLPRS